MNSNNLNNQYGSSLPVPANSRDSNVQDPLVSDTSDDSLGRHFNKLNISEQVNASTAAHHSTSAVPSNSTTDGSTTVGQDTSAASGQSSHQIPQASRFIPFYGQPMYAFPPYGQPNPSVFFPPMYPQFMGSTGTQPMLPGYPPYGYSNYQAPTFIPTAATHLTSKSDASFEASSPQVTADKLETPPSTDPVHSVLPMTTPMSQYRLFFSPKLQVVSTKDGFNTWIKNFISVLEDYHLSELLLDKQGHSKRPASVTERQTFDATLHYYVKDEFLPNWFQTAIKSSDDAHDSTQRAIYLHQQKHDQSNLWSQLKSLSYDGTSNAFIFISQVRAIISLFPDGTSSEVSSLIITILFDALHGSYTSIVKKSAPKTESYTVNDVLDAIQFEYDFHERYQKSHRITSGKPTLTICSYCKKSGHSASQCYAKQNKEKASHKSSTRYKNKKSSHHISVTGPTTPDTTTPSSGDDDDSLRPTSSDSINADATNDDNSINLNHYMLLDTGSNISIVNDMAFLHDISQDYIPPSIEDTENRPISHKARGILKLRFPGGKIVNLTAYYAPNSDTNIIGALTLERDDIYLCGKTRTLEGKNNYQFATKIIDTLKHKFDTKIVNDGKKNDKNIYDILGLQIEYVKGEYMNFGMEKGMEEKLPKLNVNLQPKRNAPGPPGKIPTQKDLIVTKEEYKEKVKWMQKIVGLTSYVAHKYRFDLLYYVNILARFTLYPSKEIMELAKYLVQYLWCSRAKKLIWYKNQKFNDKNKLTAITDAAFGTQAECKSQYGNIIYLNGNPIGAKSTRSSLTCTSSTEAEIYAISEAISILQLVELLVSHLDDKLIEKEIITDSSPSLYSFKNSDSSKFKSKFFTTRLLRSKEIVKEENIKMSYINTKENIADILTKPVEVKDFEHLTKDWIL